MADTTFLVPDLAVRVEDGALDGLRQDYVETKIADAVAYILDECPRVAARLREGTLSENNYKRVVADVVMRVVRNPEGLQTESEGGYSYGARASVASGDFWLSDRDRRTLNGSNPAMGLGTMSIGLDRGWA
jgi:hypothetical protein